MENNPDKIKCVNCGRLFIKFRNGSPFTETCIKCIKKSIHLTNEQIRTIISSQNEIINPKKKKKSLINFT
ncbi:hypothetical protein LCGC14_1267830 [marine sediment metagenome]|uniref:Uncharacterized protein n=1 Tax=marine sediment metagenome TaxID=412755 RepID=A0A0F9P260_9ZZZZ